MREIDCALIAGHANRRPVRARHDVRAEAERFDNANDVVDLASPGVGCHYDEHEIRSGYLGKLSASVKFNPRFWFLLRSKSAAARARSRRGVAHIAAAASAFRRGAWPVRPR